MQGWGREDLHTLNLIDWCCSSRLSSASFGGEEFPP